MHSTIDLGLYTLNCRSFRLPQTIDHNNSTINIGLDHKDDSSYYYWSLYILLQQGIYHQTTTIHIPWTPLIQDTMVWKPLIFYNITFFYKKEGPRPPPKPIFRVVYILHGPLGAMMLDCTVHFVLRCILCFALCPTKCPVFTQKLGQVGLCPTSPQHSHVTRLKSLSFFASDFCCNLVVGLVELL